MISQESQNANVLRRVVCVNHIPYVVNIHLAKNDIIHLSEAFRVSDVVPGLLQNHMERTQWLNFHAARGNFRLEVSLEPKFEVIGLRISRRNRWMMRYLLADESEVFVLNFEGFPQYGVEGFFVAIYIGSIGGDPETHDVTHAKPLVWFLVGFL